MKISVVTIVRNDCTHIEETLNSVLGQSGEGFARISYAYSLRHIETALDRVEQMIKDRNLHLS